MKKSALTFLLSCFLLLTAATAQYKEAPNGFAFRWTWNNFQFPLTQDLDRHDYSSGVELTYIRSLGNYLNVAFPLKVGKAYLPLDSDGTERSEQLIGSFDALLHLKLCKPDNLLYPYLLGGAGLMAEVDNDWELNPEFPMGLGLNLRLAPHFYASVETQYRFDLSDNRNQLQHAAGIWFIIGGYEEKEVIVDADKDGIPDAEDQCPNEPGAAALFGCPDRDGDSVADKFDDCPDAAGLPALAGCPDRDGDKVADHLDDCPDQPGTPERKGCPNLDRDNDGIVDASDRCPDQPGKASANGCPDQDGDGIADASDRCPDTAGSDRFSGCPDTDGDGIADPDDKCPNTAGPATNSGCPELKPEEKQVLETAMKAIQFETGSAKFLPQSFKILDEIVALVKRYPDYKVRISGHTDSIGEPAQNTPLSEKRAKACFDYLVSKGIAAARMSHAGFGESKPIGDNRFAAGREKNRRVEFELYVE